MRELHRRDRALSFDETKDAREHLDLLVFPKPKILRTDATFRHDRGRFRHDHRRAADRTRAEMDEMPVVREAVLARILTHRRDTNAIPQLHIAELERREEVGLHQRLYAF